MLRSAMLHRMKVRVRPYIASDKSFARTLFQLISGSFEEFGLTLEFIEEEASDFHYETVLELLEKHPLTLVVAHLVIRDALSLAITPGLGSIKNQSVIISSLEGRYTPPELVGVVWHEIGENLFHLSHHPLKSGFACAMGDIVSQAEVSQALFSTHHGEFSKDILERYKRLPPAFCQECAARVRIINKKLY
jgi:hypothetical protein